MTLIRHLGSIGLSLLALTSLSACGEEPTTYSYLMQHPRYLQHVYNGCVEKVVGESVPCELIMRAQADFTDLINQREQDPERFGARVLQQEENRVYLQRQFNAAWQAYNQVGNSRPPPKLEDLKKMRIELDKREEAYRSSDLQEKILLSVIAATSNV